MKMKILLGVIMSVFIGILVAVYFIARAANPIMLDEHGKPIGQVSGDAGR